MAGYLQSGEDRDERKTHVTCPSDGFEAEIPRKGVKCFVVTILPEHPYHCKLESDFKKYVLTPRITRAAKCEDVQWKWLVDFPSRLNPLAWYRAHKHVVIVLPRHEE